MLEMSNYFTQSVHLAFIAHLESLANQSLYLGSQSHSLENLHLPIVVKAFNRRYTTKFDISVSRQKHLSVEAAVKHVTCGPGLNGPSPTNIVGCLRQAPCKTLIFFLFILSSMFY